MNQHTSNDSAGPQAARKTVLIVDDEDSFRRRLMRAFQERGYEVQGAAIADEAISAALQESPEYAVVDLRMPGASGLHVVRKLHELDPTTRTVVFTGFGSIATALEAIRLGATHYLTKPADLDEILAALEKGGAAGDADRPSEVPSLARVEREHIERVLLNCGGNVTRAAELLGLHRRSLQRKLSKFPSCR